MGKTGDKVGDVQDEFVRQFVTLKDKELPSNQSREIWRHLESAMEAPDLLEQPQGRNARRTLRALGPFAAAAAAVVLVGGGNSISWSCFHNPQGRYGNGGDRPELASERASYLTHYHNVDGRRPASPRANQF